MKPQTKLPLSVVIMAKNEEKNLPDCLKSCSFAHEIILVDDSSTDKTVDIANSFGCRIFHRSMNGDFGEQQTFAIQQATQDWIFLLDCDERISETLKDSIEVAIKKNTEFAYEVQRSNRFHHFKATHGTLRPDYVARLFPNRNIYVKGQVHSKIVHSFPLKKLSGFLIHYPYTNMEQYYRKLNQYARLSADKYITQNRKASFFRDIVFRPIWATFKVYFINLGFLDGKMGFIFAANHYCYTLQKYVRFWISEKTKGDPL